MKAWCYWISETQDPELFGGYVPSVVNENERGHSMLTGDPNKFQTPWVWGKTLAEAQEICREQNAKLGIDEKTALRIVCSSMFHAIRKAPIRKVKAEKP